MATKFGVPIGIATRWRFEKSSKAIKAFFFASLHFARFLDTLQRAMLYLPLSTETGKADFQGLPNWKAHGPIETKFDTADRCCYIVGLPRTTNSLQSLQGALFPLSIWWICRFSVCFFLIFNPPADFVANSANDAITESQPRPGNWQTNWPIISVFPRIWSKNWLTEQTSVKENLE